MKVVSEFPDNGWKLGIIDSLLKRIRKTVTIVRHGNQAAVDLDRAFGAQQWRTSCYVRRTIQKGIDQLVRFRMKLPFSVQVCTG